MKLPLAQCVYKIIVPLLLLIWARKQNHPFFDAKSCLTHKKYKCCQMRPNSASLLIPRTRPRHVCVNSLLGQRRHRSSLIWRRSSIREKVEREIVGKTKNDLCLSITRRLRIAAINYRTLVGKLPPCQRAAYKKTVAQEIKELAEKLSSVTRVRNKHRFIIQALHSLVNVARHNARALLARRCNLSHHLAPFLDQLWSSLYFNMALLTPFVSTLRSLLTKSSHESRKRHAKPSSANTFRTFRSRRFTKRSWRLSSGFRIT